ncbi:MAG TPA: hypothetical protein VEW48_04175 [Thermoanaerobaculia bacterium]|nr:hypothetical protein [Thermoanaerobaculia bacterium]
MSAPGLLPATLAVLALAAALVFLGSRFSGALIRPGDGAPHRWVVYGMSGALAVHLLLMGLDLLGVPWHPLLVAGLLALGIGLAHVLPPLARARRAVEPARLPSDLAWGDGLALFAFAVFACTAVTLWTMTPDFIYHWGIKGHRFFLHRGVDYAWLARPWSWPLHPDYPNLLPELFAAGALFAGGFEPHAQMLWTLIFFLAMLAAAREALRTAGDRWTGQASLAILGLTSALFGMGHLMAGGADWMIAAAFLAALPALLRPPDRAGDWQAGLAAAFAASSKIEGAPFAVILVATQLARRVIDERRVDWKAALRLGLPSVAVGVPWLLQVVRHHLFLGSNAGPFEPARARVIGPALVEALADPAWHGLSLLVFLGPVLLLVRRTRPVAWLATLQLLFYLYVYFTAPVEPRGYIISSFSRLIFHLIPALLVAGGIAGGEGIAGSSPPHPVRAPAGS